MEMIYLIGIHTKLPSYQVTVVLVLVQHPIVIVSLHQSATHSESVTKGARQYNSLRGGIVHLFVLLTVYVSENNYVAIIHWMTASHALGLVSLLFIADLHSL